MKKIYNYTFLSLLMFCLCTTLSFAQNKINVTGEIKDGENYDALAGVSISVKNSKNGTVTDQSGKFKLNDIPSNAILVISLMGYNSQEVSVSGRSVINISLASSTQEIETVVVSGYGITTSKKNNTSAVSKVDAATLRNTTAISAAEFLQGKVAGVDVTSNDGTPGAGLNINIRGRASLSGGTSPLFVIDGIPYPISNSDVTNPTANINPNDIESIDVLKDASATALYGVGASNGVVVITTKRGKLGKPTVNFSVKHGEGEFSRTLETLSAKEYALLRASIARENVGNATDGSDLAKLVEFPGRPGVWELLATFDPNERAEPGFSAIDQFNKYGVSNFTGTNWLKKITQNTTKNFYDVDISGATQGGTSYFWSLGYANETGAIINSGFNRLTTRLNVEQKISKIFNASMRLQYSNTEFEGLIGDNRADNAIAQANFLNPYLNENNVLGINDNILNNGGNGNGPESPFYRVNNTQANRNNNGFIGNLSFTAKPLPWLGFTVQTGLTNDNKNREYFVPRELREAQNTFGKAITNFENDFKWSIAPRINIDKKFSNGVSVSAALVNEVKSSTQKGLESEYTNFLNESLKIYSINTAKTIQAKPSFTNNKDISYLARTQLDYKSKYILTLSVRHDGSSRFRNRTLEDGTVKNNQYGTFPAASIAWNVADEKFMKKINNTVSTFKLRLGYGIVGNNAIPNNSSLEYYNSSQVGYASDGKLEPTYTLNNRLFNPDITWESSKSANLGLDLGFFKEKLLLSLNLYNTNTENLLIDTPLPTYTGYTSQYQNKGKLNNKGLEVEVTSRNIARGAFKWTTGFNISFIRNKIVDLGGENELSFRGASSGSNPNDLVLRVGGSLGDYFGMIQDGLINNVNELVNSAPKENDNNVGEFGFFDLDGNGIISRSETVKIANTLPKHTGGMTNTFNYKGFELYSSLRWSYGNDVINNNINRSMYLRGDNNIPKVIQNDIWTSGKQNANYQSYSALFTTRIAALMSRSEMVEDGSFLRLETVKLSYNLPNSILKRIGLSNVRLSASGQNLFVLTRYSWYDPEVNGATGPNKQLLIGMDQGNYPRSRFVLFGIDVTI